MLQVIAQLLRLAGLNCILLIHDGLQGEAKLVITQILFLFDLLRPLSRLVLYLRTLVNTAF